MRSYHSYVHTSFSWLIWPNTRSCEYVTCWYLLHCYTTNSIFSLPLIPFFHPFKTGESESGLQTSTKYTQPFHNHHLPLSPRPAEERTHRYQYLARLAYHFPRELPSCQPEGTWRGYGRVWGFACRSKCWNVRDSEGWDCDSYVIRDDGGCFQLNRTPRVLKGRLGHRWVLFICE